jgi:hypothetical protein
VYVNDSSTSVPSRIRGVQFGFGQTCGAENGLTDCAGTRNWPFLVEATVAVLLAVNSAVCDSIGFCGLVPGLKQSMVAE